MKIMLDTNMLISALVFDGVAGKLLELLLDSEHDLYVSEYIDHEFYDKMCQKWTDKAERAYKMLHMFDIHFCDSTEEVMGTVRDAKDIPVLSDALYHNIDILVTGDKDFTDSDIKKPLILSPRLLYDYLTK